MKCLSVHQPWASLEVTSKRKIEVRKWETPYRGELLIHAGKKVEENECERLNTHPTITGAIIGIVNLVRIEQASEKRWNELRDVHLEQGKRFYGDKTFLWFFDDAKEFSRPIPYRGLLGLFEIPDEIVRKSLKEI